MTNNTQTHSRLQLLSQLGQSVWIDWLSRDLLQSGLLQHLIATHGVTGVTTNPTILEHAIASSDAYAEEIAELTAAGLEPRRVFEEITASDIRDASQQLLPVWQASDGADGYISWEVDPWLAWDASATVAEVGRLAGRAGLPNVLIKIPATEPGLQAIEDSIAAGHSVNVTLIFSLDRYAAVIEAYLRGLHRASSLGRDLSRIHSVASFFISRLDTAADELLDASESPLASGLRGRLGIASAKLAYRHYREAFSGPRWAALNRSGATPQRPLWASTSTKNPAYRDVRYVEELIGPQTVTTLPEPTLHAFEDHGRVAHTLDRHIDAAERILRNLADADIDLDQLTDRLERDGVAQFARSFDAVLERIDARTRKRLAA
jgi:transaldolase